MSPESLQGNLAGRPDLSAFFGQLSPQRNAQLLDRLLAVDSRLSRLAQQASLHVGVPYRLIGLTLVLRADGTSAGIHGGPSGDAGDIWFDISHVPSSVGASDAPRWVVESSIFVFCLDRPEPPGVSNTHEILCLSEEASTPEAALDVLDSHVGIIEKDLKRYPPTRFTSTLHDELP